MSRAGTATTSSPGPRCPVLRSRGILARPCLDWTPAGAAHLAGAMPAAITARLLDLRLLTRTSGRGLRPARTTRPGVDGWLSRDVREGETDYQTGWG